MDVEKKVLKSSQQISVANLSYTYPDGTKALHKIDFQIHQQEKVALVGANGSGKSTLQLHLNGILLPQSGRVEICGRSVNRENILTIRNFVGLVFQNPDDQLFMPTVWEDIGFGPLNLGFRGNLLNEKIVRAMRSVDLEPQWYSSRNIDRLSGGEKKRVALAGILAMEPSILVLDEPSAQLDPRSRRQTIELLTKLNQTQLIATHDLDLALELCSRTIVLSHGTIVYDGMTETVMNNTEFLKQHSLETPLSYTRPYCQIGDGPD
jgi:cobalt/nickel transport system ATP-binding protein